MKSSLLSSTRTRHYTDVGWKGNVTKLSNGDIRHQVGHVIRMNFVAG